MKKSDLITAGAVIGGGLLLYQLLKGKLKETTAPVAQAIAEFWVALTAAPQMQVLGNIVFPDGQKTPLSSATIKRDTAGNVFTMRSGRVYQLQSHNAQGDWPATLVK